MPLFIVLTSISRVCSGRRTYATVVFSRYQRLGEHPKVRV